MIEKLVTYGVGASGVAVDLKYVETDFSKTRLRQRQTKEARIEFNVMDGHTIVTLPATEKARGTAEALRIDSRQKTSRYWRRGGRSFSYQRSEAANLVFYQPHKHVRILSLRM